MQNTRMGEHLQSSAGTQWPGREVLTKRTFKLRFEIAVVFSANDSIVKNS